LKIKKDTTIKDVFYLSARMFREGSCMFGLPPDAPLPDTVLPSESNILRKQELEDTLKRFKTDDSFTKDTYESLFVTDEADKEKLENLLEQAKLYEPPIPELLPLKEAVILQLNKALEEPIPKTKKENPPPFEDWRKSKIEFYKVLLEQARRQCRKDKETAKKHTKWIKALKESFNV
jgi:hypothetical protein